jgi:hypothetical protein
MMNLTGLLQIGSTEKHSGKTTFSVRLIKSIIEKHPDIILYGIKVTILRDKEKSEGFSIYEEKNTDNEKDTSRLLRAGAAGVYWLRTDEKNVISGLNEIISILKPEGMIVCESNSLRKFVKPDFFLMIKRNNMDSMKESASEVLKFADIVIFSEMKENEVKYSPEIIDKLDISNGRWFLKETR